MISVGRILEGAFSVLRENLVAVAIWGGIYFAFNIAFTLVMSPVIRHSFGPGVSVNDTAELMSAAIPIWLLSLLLGVVGVILYTASMRSVLRPDTRGIAFLRLGLDELRMLGLCLLFGIAGFALLLAASLITGLFLGSVAASTESVLLRAILSLLVGLVLFGTAAFFIIRFSLAFPLTLHRGAFAIGEAWTRSRGHFWKLFGAALVVTLIGLVASVAVNLVTAGSHFADLLATLGDASAADDGTSVQVVLPQKAEAGSFSMLVFLQSIGGGAVAAVWIALSGGSAATAARLLVEDEFSDAEDVFG
jgi:hypothetical protein